MNSVEIRTADIEYHENDRSVTQQEIEDFHSVLPGGRGDGLTVVVMDSGIDTTHPTFKGAEVSQVNVVGSQDEDRVGHGTGVAGLIHRLAPEAEIISLRIFDQEGSTSFRTIRKSYGWLNSNSEKFDVVNMSWGSPQNVPEINELHNTLEKKNVFCVTSAGNTGDESGSPATASSAFSVGACKLDGTLAKFSSDNPNYDNPDVTAVGKHIQLDRAVGTSMGTPIDQHTTIASGTSFSAPIVCGIYLCMRSSDIEATEKEIHEALEDTAKDIPDTIEEGAGIVNQHKATESLPKKEKEKTPEEIQREKFWEIYRKLWEQWREYIRK